MEVGRFIRALGIGPKKKALSQFAADCGVPLGRLQYYARHDSMPTGADLDKICQTLGVTHTLLALRLGVIDERLASALSRVADDIEDLLEGKLAEEINNATPPSPALKTAFGTLYRSDCLDMLRSIPSDTVDVVFADPPFNLAKFYPSGINDELPEEEYVAWCEAWAAECCRVLTHGGSMFIWNLPKWNVLMGRFLSSRLTFRHWIAVDIKYRLPIAGRLYPSHYGLLYFTKGESPRVFHPDRLPMEVCPDCAADLRDYGGYKSKMNPRGVSLADVWYDIPPVRHGKYKRRQGANELSIKLMDRILELSTDPGDLVLDPFGGSGTTYVVAELKGRRWVGSELGPIDDIISRFERIEEERGYLSSIRAGYNQLHTEPTLRKREARGLWTAASVRDGATGGNEAGSTLFD